MVGRTGFNKYCRNAKHTKSYNGQDFEERNYHLHSEGTTNIKENVCIISEMSA